MGGASGMALGIALNVSFPVVASRRTAGGVLELGSFLPSALCATGLVPSSVTGVHYSTGGPPNHRSGSVDLSGMAPPALRYAAALAARWTGSTAAYLAAAWGPPALISHNPPRAGARLSSSDAPRHARGWARPFKVVPCGTGMVAAAAACRRGVCRMRPCPLAPLGGAAGDGGFALVAGGYDAALPGSPAAWAPRVGACSRDRLPPRYRSCSRPAMRALLPPPPRRGSSPSSACAVSERQQPCSSGGADRLRMVGARLLLTGGVPLRPPARPASVPSLPMEDDEPNRLHAASPALLVPGVATTEDCLWTIVASARCIASGVRFISARSARPVPRSSASSAARPNAVSTWSFPPKRSCRCCIARFTAL